MIYKIGVFNSFAKFTEKHRWQNLFFNKTTNLINLNLKRDSTQVFSASITDLMWRELLPGIFNPVGNYVKINNNNTAIMCKVVPEIIMKINGHEL